MSRRAGPGPAPQPPPPPAPTPLAAGQQLPLPAAPALPDPLPADDDDRDALVDRFVAAAHERIERRHPVARENQRFGQLTAELADGEGVCCFAGALSCVCVCAGCAAAVGGS